MLTFHCPNCNNLREASVDNVYFSYPTNGGDYEWVETSATTTCKSCAKSFSSRVRVDLDSRTVDEIVSID